MALEYYETGEPMKIKCFTMKPQKTAAVIRLPQMLASDWPDW